MKQYLIKLHLVEQAHKVIASLDVNQNKEWYWLLTDDGLVIRSLTPMKFEFPVKEMEDFDPAKDEHVPELGWETQYILFGIAKAMRSVIIKSYNHEIKDKTCALAFLADRAIHMAWMMPGFSLIHEADFLLKWGRFRRRLYYKRMFKSIFRRNK